MKNSASPSPIALTELSEADLESVTGGSLECDLVGNAAQMVSGAAGAALIRSPNPYGFAVGLGLVGGAGAIGSIAKEICTWAGYWGGGSAGSIAVPRTK